MVVLNLLEFDPNLLWKKVRVLLLIVRVLVSLVSESEKSESSVKFEKLFGDNDDDDGCTASVAEDFVASLCFLKPLDPCRPFLCALIEVIAEKLKHLLAFDFNYAVAKLSFGDLVCLI